MLPGLSIFSLIVVLIRRSPTSLDNLCWSLKIKVVQAGYELAVFSRQASNSVLSWLLFGWDSRHVKRPS